MGKKKSLTVWGSVLVGVMVFTLVAVLAWGHEKGKGPRASVSVATVCELDGTNFIVESRIRDKTSGEAIPVVTGWNVQPFYLKRGEPGNVLFPFKFAKFSESGLTRLLPWPPEILKKEATFNLCAVEGASGGEGGIHSDLKDARTLNALVTTSYGRMEDGSSVGDVRDINNRCSDDPETLEVEPSGIKLTHEVIDLIDQLCLFPDPVLPE